MAVEEADPGGEQEEQSNGVYGNLYPKSPTAGSLYVHQLRISGRLVDRMPSS